MPPGILCSPDKTQENKSQLVANSVSQKQNDSESTFQFVDNRPEAFAQQKLQEMANNSPKVKQLRAFQAVADNSPQAKHAVQLLAMIDNHLAQQRYCQLKSIDSNFNQK